jgi:tetratricopeptide (TPR) repeat protein
MSELVGALYSQKDRLQECIDLGRRVIDAQRRRLGAEAPETLRTRDYVGYALVVSGRAAEALPEMETSVAAQVRVLGEEHLDTLFAMQHLASANELTGNLERARVLLERVWTIRRRLQAPDHPDQYWAMSNLGHILRQQGKLDEAMALYDQVLEYRLRHLGEEHSDTLRTAETIAGTLLRQGKREQARAHCSRFLRAARGLMSWEHPHVPRDWQAMVLNTLVRPLVFLGPPAAEDIAPCVEAAEWAVKLAPENKTYRKTLGVAYYRAGRRQEATALMEMDLGDLGAMIQAEDARQQAEGFLQSKQWDMAIGAYAQAVDLEPKTALTRNNLAWLLTTCPDSKLRDPSRAVELAKKAVELAPKEGTLWNTLGVAQYRAGDWKAAIEALSKSMELRNGGDSNDWFFLAMAHWQLGDKPQARSWFDKAVEWMEKNQPRDEELLRFRDEAAALLEVNETKH